MSASRMHPLLLLKAKMLQLSGWKSADVMTCRMQAVVTKLRSLTLHSTSLSRAVHQVQMKVVRPSNIPAIQSFLRFVSVLTLGVCTRCLAAM